MRENVSLITTRVIQIGLVALAFLLPVFFVPTTSEFYNFNKTTLLTIGVAILFLLWGAKMVAEQRVRITRTPLDVPLLIFLIIYILATVFSLDPNVSLLGWHPVFFGSLPSVAAVVILYFLATTHLDSTYRTWVTYALVASASLLAVAGIAGFIGQPLFSANWAQARNWTAAGDLNKLAFFLAMAIPLTISAALFVKETPYRYLFYVLAGVQIVSFILINSIPAYIVIAAGLFFVLLLSPKVEIKSEIRTALGILGAVAVAVLLVVNVKGLADNILKPFIISEDKATTITKPITLPLSAAWQTSARAVAERPVFGYGPATYGLIFPSFKPVTLNQVNTNNLWNIRFDEPSSGILNLLATTGVAGTIAFVLVVIFLIRSLISFSAGSNLIRSNTHILFLQGSLVAFLVGFIFFDFSAITTVAFILLAAIFFTAIRDWGSSLADEVDLQLVELRSGALRTVEPSERSKPNALSWVLFVPALLIFVAAAIYIWGTYRAEVYYYQAIIASQDASKANETHQKLVDAIRANPYRDTYRRSLLLTDFALARALSQKGKLTDQEQNTLQTLVGEAIDQGRVATGYEGRSLGSFQIKKQAGTSSFNVANWESLAAVYASIGGEVRQNAAVHAINTFSQGLSLDPTNPRLYEALGNVYFNNGDTDNAIKNFELSIRSKGDYASGHYSLAQAVKKKGDNPTRVAAELDATLQLLPSDSPDRNRVKKELDEAIAAAKKATPQAQQQKPATLTQPQTPPLSTSSATP